MRIPIRAMIVAVIALSLAPSGVSAHATLVTSTPAGGAVLESLPPAITLTFDDPLLPSSSFEVRDDTGATVAGGSVSGTDDHSLQAPMPPLPNGTYEVRWTAATADGHIERGTFSFRVALATPDPATPQPTAPPSASMAPSDAVTDPPSAAPTGGSAPSPTAGPSNPSSDIGVSGDALIPIVVGLAIVGAGLAWFLRRRRVA
ncbi:MAG: copper resistance CopC family protein [Chloroflexota bacterium]